MDIGVPVNVDGVDIASGAGNAPVNTAGRIFVSAAGHGIPVDAAGSRIPVNFTGCSVTVNATGCGIAVHVGPVGVASIHVGVTHARRSVSNLWACSAASSCDGSLGGNEPYATEKQHDEDYDDLSHRLASFESAS
jgi:hypothetical protein